ncbi:valine--tRNA ligase [Mycoplasmopsis ciconiae]|uniref:Valine--tRNA ligase n=1 Tax=Mycoplasmopsis ciconiae TaxID=561067 RepID=A0ABU7MKH3_9BACT|nr:valine--tRNA ligase [Mycoplasmopsis ciconiae]
MEKIYNHKQVEANTELKWRQKGYFSKHDTRKKPFSILLPPPNVTGKLHLGHALDNLIQDTVIRYKKLQDYDVFWISGMDHAGIATQAKVEQNLYEESKLTKHDLGREKFLEKVWEWKDKYANLFRKQWQSLGLALDYENERFTLDEKANEAVLKVFVDLYNKGLIYKGSKAIYWDPVLQTALSNIEVENKDTDQNMYYIKYPVKDSNEFLIVATVRTETLLSDVALVYNPNDQRYKHLKNKVALHPITKKELPIIEDEYVSVDFGSGVMKLSAHAEADIDIIKKQNLEIIETIDKKGYINYPNSEFDKLERFEARKVIAKYLEDNNFLEKVVPNTSAVGYSQRSGAPVEILVTDQWFVKMDKFASDILKHLNTEEKVKFYPKRFENILIQWMENIHDWTISRQLWWGHRIPAWYKDGQMKVQIDSPGQGWVQDEDVLDTWFSSGISPFAFLGWPQSQEMLKRYYPTNLLVTGYDLIFFWIARMYLFGLEFMNQKPFDDILIHGLIRDEQNRKMSKSLNNGIDPLDVVDEYGSDALRWFLITNTTPGTDIRFSTEKIKAAWALNNKLWNICRYINEMPDQENNTLSDADKWIHNKVYFLSKNIEEAMNKYEFPIIGNEISKFIYNDLSGWYIELLKNNPSKKQALKVLDNVLVLLHPFLPFITDKIYSQIFDKEILEQRFKELPHYSDVDYIDDVIEIVTIIRKYREDQSLSKKDLIEYYLDFELPSIALESINKLGYAAIKENKDAFFNLNRGHMFIKMDQNLKDENKKRLLEKIDSIKFEINRAQNMLNNPRFVEKAPAQKVEEEKNKLAKYQEELAKYEKELECKY